MTIDVTAIKILLSNLQDDPIPQVLLQKKCGLGNASMGRWMRALKGQIAKNGQRTNSLIYVAEWHKHGNVTVPYWSWGKDQIDAMRPRAFTTQQYNSRASEKRRIARLTLVHS